MNKLNEQIHIVIFDDNIDILEMVQDVLEIRSYRVTTCQLLNEFKETVARDSPDIIICDILMSGLDGRTICQDLKADPKTENIPLILFSALRNSKKSATEAGADFFLEKPFDIDALYRLIDDAIAI